MKKIYLSEKSNRILREYLEGLGYSLAYISTEGIVDDPIACHPDIFMCKMGADDIASVVFAEEKEIGRKYPSDIAFNAACTGKYFFHRLDSTNPRLLQRAESMGMKLINVRQGYTKCSTVVVDNNSIITYDNGIITACNKYPEINVLKVEPGHCYLEGYDTGFIGGCSGRVGNKVVFNGNLQAHPDYRKILSFIESRSLECVWFPQYRLTDIGSIIAVDE